MTDIERRSKSAIEEGWTDVRLSRVFGRGLVLRGFKHFVVHGVPVSTREDVPMYDDKDQ